MAVSGLKLFADGEKLFRQYPILTNNYIWVLVKSTYIPLQSHSTFVDISSHVCDSAGYTNVDATGAAFIATHDPDFSNPEFVSGAEGKYVVLCTKTGSQPDKLVGFFDVEIGLNNDVIFTAPVNINVGGVLDYTIEGWSYPGSGSGGGGGGPGQGAQTDVVITQPARTGAANSYPLNFCVPYPKGILSSTSTFALYDQSNVIKRAQFDAFERWEDNSIKMLHVCTDASFDSAKTYTVKSGVSQNFPAAATVTNVSGVVTVSFAGKNYVTNNSGFTFCNGFRIYALNALDNLEYLSVNGSTTVVENGEIRVVLRSEGELRNGSNILMHFILRQYFYPISGIIEIELTVEDRVYSTNASADAGSKAQINGGTRVLTISIAELGIKDANSYNRLFAQGSSSDHDQTSASELKLEQYATHIKIGSVQQPYVFSYEGMATGGKASGAFNAYRTTGGEQLGIAYKDFWRAFPSGVSASSSGLKIKFHCCNTAPDTQWPSMAGSDEFKFPNTFFHAIRGIAKTYKMMFLINGQSTTEIKNVNSIYDQSYFPLALPSLDYIRSTKVFGDYKLSNSLTTTYDNRKNNNINASYWNGIDGTTISKNGVNYGWRWFGNRAYGLLTGSVSTTLHPGSTAKVSSFFNGTHFGGDRFLLQYLRGGNEKYWYITAVETQAFCDLSICHAPRNGYWQIAGTNTNIVFNGGEVTCMNHDQLDVAARNYTGSHFHLGSMCTFWLLEKNYRYKEVLEKISTWLATLVENWYPKNSYATFGAVGIPQTRPFTEAEREVGNNLVNACKIMHYLNKSNYWDDCVVKIINYLILWIKTEAPHYQQGVQIGTHSWSTGDAYWWLDKSANAIPPSTACNPWMAGVVLGGMAMARELSIRFNKTLPTDFYDMANKAILYVVKWGRNTSGQWLYVEGGSLVENAFNLAYPLAYWGNYFNNSGWYDLGLAIHNGNLAQTYQDSNYFYGYEEILWPEQFKIFNT
jgi:hypothetical protein